MFSWNLLYGHRDELIDRLSIRELLLFGLLLFVFGCEGTWLDCFLWVATT